MKMGKNTFTGLCFLSVISILLAGSVWASQLSDLPPPRASLSVNYLEAETTPRYEGIPQQPDIEAETEGLPQAEGVAGGVVEVSELPVADRAADSVFQAPRSHIQGEFLQFQDTQAGEAIEPIMPPGDGLPEIQQPSQDEASGDYVRQWTAISNSTMIPPDTIHAVGPTHILEAVNSGFAIYTKLGTEVQGYTTFDSFVNKPSGWQGFLYDPRVVYDWDHDKFVMLILGKDEPNLESYFWLAVSQTSDPTGDWWIWRFGATDYGGSSTAWLDYAGLGADRWGVYITGNYFYFSGGFRGSNLWTFNPDIFNGGATNGWQWVDLDWPDGSDAFSLQPAHPHSVNSSEETYFVNTYSGSGNKVCLWKLSGDRDSSPGLTRTEIGIDAYHAIGNNVDQPNSATDIDGGDARVMNAIYANRRVFFTLTNDWNDDVNACGWQTVKLNSDTNAKEWEHFLWGGDGAYYFYPAVTLAGSSTSGNLAVFGSWTLTAGGSQYASGLYKIYDDQPNSATGPFANMVSGLASYVSLDSKGRNRWGDYSGAGYDWECGHAWGAVESADTSNRWRTTIGARFFDVEAPCILIEVSAPNGGETWPSGTSRTITWKRANLPTTDDVYIFFNDGSTSTQIAGPLSPSASFFSWNVSGTPTTQAKIFVGSWNGSTYTVSDWSDDFFTVSADPPVIDDIDFDTCISECPTCPDSNIVVTAHDPAGGSLSYVWTALNGGTVLGSGASVNFDPPDNGPHACPYNVRVQVTSSVSGLTTTQIVPIRVKLKGDVDANGVVNILDKVAVRNAFGSSGAPGWIPADVDCNGVVNILDKVAVRNQFGQSGCACP